MGLDDMVSTESAFVAVVTAAVFSPKTRSTLRRGAVLGVAGALKVGDVVAGATRGVVNGIRGDGTDAASRNGDFAGGTPESPAASPEAARPGTRRRPGAPTPPPASGPPRPRGRSATPAPEA